MKLTKSKLLYKQHITSNCTYSFVGKSLLIAQNTVLHNNLSLQQSELEWMFLVAKPSFIVDFFLVYFSWLHCHHVFIYYGYPVTTCLFMMVTLSPHVYLWWLHCHHVILY